MWPSRRPIPPETVPVSPRSRTIVTWILLGLAYLVAAVVFTWPLARHLGTHVWGDRFDAWTTLWLLWFLHHLITVGPLSEVTELISYPVGYNLWSFGHMALQFFAVPIIALGFSVTAAYNLLGIGGLAATATAGHALGRGLSGSHVGGALAACVMAFTPLLYGEFSVGSIELVAAFFIPLYVLAVVRLAEQPSLGRAAVVAAVLALTGPFNWYYSIFCILLTPPLALLLCIGRERRLSLRFGGALLAAGLVVLLVTMPLFDKIRRETPPRIPLTVEVATPDSLERLNEFRDSRIALEDIERSELEHFEAAQVVVNSTTMRTLLRSAFMVNPLDSTPGALAVVLALVGLAANPRKGWRWAILAALFVLLTFGPFYRWDAGSAPGASARTMPLPYYYLYNYVPYFSKAYRPYRLGIVTITAMAAMAAMAGPWLRELVGRRWVPIPLALVVGLFATQPHWASGKPSQRGLSDTTVPAVYHQLAGLPAGALIELPLHYQPAHLGVAQFQYFQIVHGRPLLNNNQLIRIDDLLALRDLARDNPLVHRLVKLDELPPNEPVEVRREDLQALCDQGFRLISVHESYPADQAHLAGGAENTGMLPGQAFALIDDLFGPPLLEGDGVRFYDLHRGLGPEPVVPLEPRHFVPGDLGALDVFVTAHTASFMPQLSTPGSQLELAVAPEGSELRQASVWARGVQPGELAFRFRARDGAVVGEAVPVAVDPGAWRRLAVAAPPGAASVALINPGQERVAALLTRSWVELAAVEPELVDDAVLEQGP